MKIKEILAWIYIILSVFFWVAFIAGADSIEESGLLATFLIIGAIDIAVGKILNIIGFINNKE